MKWQLESSCDGSSVAGPRSSRMPSRKAVSILAVLLAASALCEGHDFWIQTAQRRAPAGILLGVQLKVGEGFSGRLLPRDPERFSSFQISGPAGTEDLRGRDGDTTAGYARLDRPGDYVIGYRSRPVSNVTEAGKFESYLREMGLESIIEARASRRQSGAPGREVYSRCAKSIVRVGEGADGGYRRLLGQTLEIVPRSDPFDASADGLFFTLLYEGRPAAGILVSVITKEHPASRDTVRTDAEGNGRLPLRDGGLYLVEAVRMGPAPAGSRADWVSIWASLTFERRPTMPER